jgi:hypothetical protein
MKTPSEPSSISPLRGNVERPEQFGPPDVTSLASLTDGRAVAQYQSAYSVGAWVQIIVELTYLLVVLGTSFAVLVVLAKYVVLKETSGWVFALIGNSTEFQKGGERLIAKLVGHDANAVSQRNDITISARRCSHHKCPQGLQQRKLQAV